MTGLKTNEREGTRAVLRYCRMSAYKAREVLDLIRGEDVGRASEILRFSERDAARVISKVLHSAVANAEANDGLDPEELYVSACYADEGTTIKRWRPRARGRATRIRKRTCHITVIVSRLPEDRLVRLRAARAAEVTARRARRVAGGRRAAAEQAVARGRQRRRGAAADPAAPVIEEEGAEAAAAEEAGTEDTGSEATAEAEVMGEAETAAETETVAEKTVTGETTAETAGETEETAEQPGPGDEGTSA